MDAFENRLFLGRPDRKADPVPHIRLGARYFLFARQSRGGLLKNASSRYNANQLHGAVPPQKKA